MDDTVKLAVALQVLYKRRSPLDVEAIAAVLHEHWPTDVLLRGLERGFGWVCGSEACNTLGALVGPERMAEARALLLDENMGDLLERARE